MICRSMPKTQANERFFRDGSSDNVEKCKKLDECHNKRPLENGITQSFGARGLFMQLFDLSGKVAVITGSTKGIGEAIAHRLAEHGAKVVVSSRKADACEKVTGEINAKWGKGKEVAYAVPCNINLKEQLEQLVAKTRAKWGKIDILVCNAAVNPVFGSMSKMTAGQRDAALGAGAVALMLSDWIEQHF